MNKRITPTEEQWGAIRAIREWYRLHKERKRNKSIRFVLGGLAGTGKSSITPHIIDELGLDYSQVHFCTFTGKASLVLRQKGLTEATTIHSFIYIPFLGRDGKIHFKKTQEFPSYIKLIVVDEASQVSRQLQQDLESFGVPVLYIGDHGQLPPISKDMSNLMESPDYRLETIHRQALDNPIIWVANQARLGKWLKYGKYGDTVLKISKNKLNSEILNSVDQVLCGKNLTRRNLNSDMRKALGFTSNYPEVNDKMICLKNNNESGLVNGMLGTCTMFNKGLLQMSFENEEGYKWENLYIDEKVFTDGLAAEYNKEIEQFDFGRAITVHKFQGSQANSVILYEEQLSDRQTHMKWIYTGCTRSIERLLIAS